MEPEAAPEELGLFEVDRDDELSSTQAQLRELGALLRRIASDKVGPLFVGRYEVGDPLGESALPTVFAGYDPVLDRSVVLKCRLTEIGGPPGRSAVEEARSLAGLRHSHIVQVYDVADDGGFLVMEHLKGHNLDQLLEASRDPLKAEGSPQLARMVRELSTWHARTRVLSLIADALAHCHLHGIVHRDVKPANIVFRGNDCFLPCLVDLGLACTERDEAAGRSFEGTAAYLAPEQIAAERTGANPASDQYSFALLAYELLSGSHPRLRKTIEETLEAGRQPLKVSIPDAPRELEAVLEKGLALRPEDRYAHVADLYADLLAVLDRRPVAAHPPSLLRSLWLAAERHRTILAWTLSAVLLVCLALGVSAVREGRGLREELERAAALSDATHHERLEKLGLLHDVRMRAEAFERTPWARLTWSDVGERSARTTDEWTEAMRGRYEQLSSFTQRPSTREWREYFVLEASLFPSRAAHELTTRGRVRFFGVDEDTHLFRHSTLDAVQPERTYPAWIRGLSGLAEVAITDMPDAGRYRFMQWTADGLLEADFEVLPDRAEELLVAPSTPFGEWLRTSRLVDAHAVALRFPAESASEHEVLGQRALPAYRISPWVTQREFTDYCSSQSLPRPTTFLRGTDDSPAYVTRSQAEGYARWCGGRLPTARELAEVIRIEQVEGASRVVQPEYRERACGEWVSDVIHHGPRTMPAYLHYVLLDDKPWATPLQWLAEAPDGMSSWCSASDGQLVAQSFRLARTEATLDEVLQSQSPTLLERKPK